MAKRIVTYKCPFCTNRYNREDLVTHVQDVHENELPADFTPFRYVFNYVNRKPLTYHGKCTECGGPTPWDENKGRYNRQCEKKACHDSFVRRFEENMIRTNGITRLSDTAEGQVKMLANRKISGKYKFKNGQEKTYTGSYERKALEFMDKVMDIEPNDILCPGPILEYTMSDGRRFMYITDFYYQPYNLIIEVKDGGNNPNKRNMPEYRAKQIAKEQFIIKHTNYNYLRLTDNNFRQLLAVFMSLKMQMVENTGERVIHINEAYDPEKEYDSQMDEIKALNRELNSWKYGVLVNGKVYTKQDDIDWSKYKTIPVDLMWKHHVGVCWDFVNLEYQWFKERHIPTDCYMFVMQKSNDPDDIVTHTFIIFKLEGKKYWFESSWYGHQHIVEVRDYKNVVKELVDRYGDHNYSVFKYSPEGLDKNITNGKFFERTTRNCIYNYEAANESYIEEADTKLFKNVIDDPEITGEYPFRSSQGIYNVNVTIKGFNKYLRGRSEMLIVDKDKVFLNKNSKGYSIPGGGWEENEDHNLSAIRETNEEAKIKVKNVSYVSKYAALFDPKDWVKEKINKENWWYGEYIELYIGEYDGTFKGKVEKIDQQKDMEEKGKFYKIKDVYKDLIPQHQKALSDFVNESYVEEASFQNYKLLDIKSNKSKVLDYLKNNSETSKYADNIINNYTGEIAVYNNSMIGRIFVGDKKDKGFITDFSIDEDYRGNKLGSRMLDDAINKYNGYDLLVDKTNKLAIDMYKKRGFTIDRTEGNQYYMKLNSVNESYEERMQDMAENSKSKALDEIMTAVGYNPVAGLRDSDAYIVNYTRNNPFADDHSDYAVIDGKMSNIIRVDKEKKKLVKEAFDPNLSLSADWHFRELKLYRVCTVEEASKKLAPYMDTEVENENLIYEVLTGKKAYTKDQADCELEAIDFFKVVKHRYDIENLVEKYIYGTDELDFLEEFVKEVTG